MMLRRARRPIGDKMEDASISFMDLIVKYNHGK